MNITIIGRKCTPRESFKERAETKLRKVEKFFGPDADAKVTATVEKNAKIVEITLSKGGYIFRAQERSQDLEEALDACVDSLIRQIRKNKTRLEKRIRELSFDDVFNSADEDEAEFDVVRTKSVIVKPESVEEAILQMNLLGHQFYMFRNSETDMLSVVYKRKDGGYGVIEPSAE
ncbi:MAG: ribosome-associated translation inhibitor RaiA [Ruminococcaceae bacterium]|nr:ribosome-associated translation inhibitor RaiA [Oscillospiraceae bacterium]